MHSRIHRAFAILATPIVAGLFLLASSSQADQTEPAKRQIFAIGGGGLEKADGPPLLMEYFLKLTGKKKPRVCFMPSASGDANADVNRWNQVMKGLECEPRVQKVYIASPKVKSFEEELLKADAIFIGGGNALNMIAMWRAQGIDKILRQAYDRGIVLGGEGAGAICWFEQGLTDSRPGKLTPMDCLGFLKGSNCARYDGEQKQKTFFQDWIQTGQIKDGIGCDNGAGMHFVDEKLVKVVGSLPSANAYHVKRDGGKVVEEKLQVEVLAK